MPRGAAALEWVPIAGLRPFDGNPRKISDAGLQKLRRSIQEFGFANPILVQRGTNMIIAGHQRWRAAQAAGLAAVPVVFLDFDDGTARAYNIADNRLAEESDWDAPALAELLRELQGVGVDLELTGFGPEEIEDLISQAGGVGADAGGDLDAAPPLPAEPVTRPGDVWVLGAHRLLCGDGTSPEDVARLMGGGLAEMVFIDPPYNVAYEDTRGRSIQNDDMEPADFLDFLTRLFGSACVATAPSAAFYVCYPSREHIAFETAAGRAGLEVRSQIVWVKNLSTFGFAHYKWRHELILYAAKRGQALAWHGDRKQTTTWFETGGPLRVTPHGDGHVITFTDGVRTFFARVAGLVGVEEDGEAASTVWEVSRETNYAHPTQKPVELITRAIRNSSRPGERVLDLCGGSGSTLIAADRAGRTALLMELDPRWCDVAVERWQTLTGGKAERQHA